MVDKEKFIEKAEHGYTVCFRADCPLHEQCLRWLTGKYLPKKPETCSCVNPNQPRAATERCPSFRSAAKKRMAQGMRCTFNDYMPRRVETGVRRELIRRSNRQYFYEYRSGKRLLSPEQQEEIRSVFRSFGWTEEVQFDGYTEEYDW